MKEIMEEYGSLVMAAVGGGMLFQLLSVLLWSDSSVFLLLIQAWQNRGL